LGELFGFGSNVYGELGIGNTEKQLSPVKINFFEKNNLKVKDFKCGNQHTVFLTS